VNIREILTINYVINSCEAPPNGPDKKLLNEHQVHVLGGLLKKLLAQIPVDAERGNIYYNQGMNLFLRLNCNKHQADWEKYSRIGNAADSLSPLTEDAKLKMIQNIIKAI